jgi:hypothetical protein
MFETLLFQGQADIFSILEKIIITLYFVGDVTLFMLICMAGTNLQIEVSITSRHFNENYIYFLHNVIDYNVM